MIIYGLKSCDSCKTARKVLAGAEFIDVRETGILDAVLEAALVRFGEKLLNTRSTTWRGLSEDQRQGKPLDLIRAHPALMKRPLVVDGDRMVLGWDKAAQAELGV